MNLKLSPNFNSRFLCALACLSLWTLLELLDPLYFCYDDNAVQFLPWYLFNANTLLRFGELPLVNFHQFMGSPHLVQGQTGVLYPPATVIALVMNHLVDIPWGTLELLALIHLALGSMAMFDFFLTRQVERSMAIGGALLYATIPFFVLCSRSWIFLVYIHAALPICFLLLERLQNNLRLKTVALYAVFKGVLWLQGSVHHPASLLIYEAVFLLSAQFHLKPSTKKPIYAWILGNIWGGLLACALLIPMYQAMGESFARQNAQKLHEFLSNAISTPMFLKAQLFLFESNVILTHGTSSHFVYIALLPIMVWLLWKFKHHTIQIPKSIEVFFPPILCALALSTVCHALLIWVPVFNRFRWPFKQFGFFGFFYAIIFILLCHTLLNKKLIKPKTAPLFILLAILSHLLVIGLGHKNSPFWDITLHAQSTAPLPPHPLLGRAVTLGFSENDLSNEKFYNKLHSHNSATLFSFLGFAGYDPLIRYDIPELVLGLNESSLLSIPNQPEIWDFLKHRSVRYYYLPEPLPNNSPPLPESFIKLNSHSNVSLYVWKDALPIISWKDTTNNFVEYSFKGNRIIISSNNVVGTLQLRVAPWRELYVFDEKQNALSFEYQHGVLLVDVTTPTSTITVEYKNHLWSWCWPISLVTMLMTLGVIICTSQKRVELPEIILPKIK